MSKISSQAASLAHHVFSSHLSDHLKFARWLSDFVLFAVSWQSIRSLDLCLVLKNDGRSPTRLDSAIISSYAGHSARPLNDQGKYSVAKGLEQR